MDGTIKDTIKEIAEQLDCGFRAFVNKTTGRLIFVPDDRSFSDYDLEAWEPELTELENNFMDYWEIDKWTSSEAFDIMHEFTEQVTDKKLQSRLLESLSKRKPFREFKFIIDNSGDVRQQWFDFRNQWQQNFVLKQVKQLKIKGL